MPAFPALSAEAETGAAKESATKQRMQNSGLF
jgi:hypothetical protein